MRKNWNAGAWKLVAIIPVTVAGACFNGQYYINSGNAPAAAQTAAALNNNARLIASGPSPIPTPTMGATLPSDSFIITGAAGVQKATDLTQFFNPTYDITGTAYTEDFGIVNGTDAPEIRISVSANNPNSRPQLAVRTAGSTAPYYTAPLNTSGPVINAGFLGKVAPETVFGIDYEFSIIDTGMSPANVIYAVTVFIQASQ